MLQLDHGSLYPALHRLQKHGGITSNTPRGREMHAYRTTAKRRRRRTVEETNWEQLVCELRMLKTV